MWYFLSKRGSNLLNNAGHTAETTEKVSPPLTSQLCALRECIMMKKLKIYSTNQPKNIGLVRNTFLPPNQ